jgi:hypothetical protein
MTPGSEYFKVFEADKYSAFDEQGLPTHDKNGKELNENLRNGAKKLMAKQQ